MLDNYPINPIIKTISAQRGGAEDRVLHYLANTPNTSTDLDELKYLITSHDFSSRLTRKYAKLMNDEVKELWLSNRLTAHHDQFYSVFMHKLCFYLLFPNFYTSRIHLTSFHHEIIFYLGGFSHLHQVFRMSARRVVTMLTPYLRNLPGSLRYRVICTLTKEVNSANFKYIDTLVSQNLESIHPDARNLYISNDLNFLDQKPKAAVKYAKRPDLIEKSVYAQVLAIAQRTDWPRLKQT